VTVAILVISALNVTVNTLALVVAIGAYRLMKKNYQGVRK